MYVIGSRPKAAAIAGANRPLVFGPSAYQHNDKEAAITEAKRLVATAAKNEYLVFQLVTGVTAEVTIETKEQEYN